MTISAYLEVKVLVIVYKFISWREDSIYLIFSLQLENCGRPAIITKDLSMVIYGRDARTGPRSLKHLFTGSYRNVEANRLSGVYELVLKRASEAGSPGRFPFETSLNQPVCFICFEDTYQ